MPEIKHQFTKGKMNKDLDERLVPNGEYRDAMNIQVSTSEDSDVGTVQNILGNREIKIKNGDSISDGENSINTSFQLSSAAVTIGSISDEKIDTLYYLVWSPNTNYIFSYKRNDSVAIPIFVDNKNVLQFSSNTLITGINIIDGMLFWTDNKTEPKKINIERCAQGTPDAVTQTFLINESQGFNSQLFAIAPLDAPEVETKHITVIKRGPMSSLKMRTETSRDPELLYTGVIKITQPISPNLSSFRGPVASSGSTNPTDRTNFTGITTLEGENTFNIAIEEAINSAGVKVPIGNINSNDGLTGWQTNPTLNQTSQPLNNIKVGTKIVFKPFDDDGSPPGLPVTDYVIKGVIEDLYPPPPPTVPTGVTLPAWQTNQNYVDSTTGATIIKVKVLSIDGNPPVVDDGQLELEYVVDLFDDNEKLFEFKFPRFSYRYKYEDGEYSTFAPFTQVAFQPGAFDYHPRKGYNLGMTNRLVKVNLYDLVRYETPKDVVSIDVLFKDEPSPIIYVVDTIRPDDYAPNGGFNTWNSILNNNAAFEIEKETINSVVPSNQLLRPYDNVPRIALAKDVTGSRIVYGNYIQNYNLTTSEFSNFFPSGQDKKYVPQFNVHTDAQYEERIYDSYLGLNISSRLSESGKSIKSLREYQVGVVFGDAYGRETPVISNESGTERVGKDKADKYSRFTVGFNGNPPDNDDLKYYKIYVKETSGEYYNMAMDRFYDAEDGNIWLAFPSSDRNKIDIDTFLILKKGSDTDTLVTAAARYKVIAIENEAPDYIKTKRSLSNSVIHSGSRNIYGLGNGSIGNGPLQGRDAFEMNYQGFFGTTAMHLDEYRNGQLYIEWEDAQTKQRSDRYRIISIEHDFDERGQSGGTGITLSNAKYYVQLDRGLGDDINFITNDSTGNSVSKIRTAVTTNIYKYEIENSPKFDGRFFVKIYEDEVFKANIGRSFLEGLDFRVLNSRKIYYMHEDHIKMHTEDVGDFLVDGMATTSWDEKDYNTIISSQELALWGFYTFREFAAHALFFRRYAKGSFAHGQADFGMSNSIGWNDSNWTNTPTKGQWPFLAHLKPVSSADNYNDDPANPHINNPIGIQYHGQHWAAKTNWDQEFGWGDQSTAMTDNFDYEDGVVEGSRSGCGHTHNFRFDIVTMANLAVSTTADVVTVRAMLERYAMPINFYDDPTDTQVWFVDNGPYAGTSYDKDDNLVWYNIGRYEDNATDWRSPWDGGNNTTNPNSNFTSSAQDTDMGLGFNTRTGDGVVNNDEDGIHKMDIAFGGIMGAHQSKNTTTGFFNFGWQPGLSNTTNDYHESEFNFIQNLNVGVSFRWKEDPTQTVYTIGGSNSNKKVFRHSTVKTGRDRSNQGSIDKDSRGVITSRPVLGQNAVDDNIYIEGSVGMSMAEALSFNFSSNWVLSDISPSYGGNWNPFADGVIPNSSGANVTLPLCDENGGDNSVNTATGSNASSDLKIFVKNLIDTNGKTLELGMAFSSYTKQGGSASQEIASLGAGSGNEFLAIRYTEKLTNSSGETFYALYLGGYKSALLTAKEHQLANGNNRPKNGENVTFVQVGMNGYSDNSEFNINTMAHNRGYGAVTAVGYNLEFIEYIEPEEILSENPAIFETEPKEIKELDVYYEATSAIPINFDETNIQDAFPINSYIIGVQGTGVTVAPIATVIDYDGLGIIVDNLAGVGATAGSSAFEYIYNIIRPDGLELNIDILSVDTSNNIIYISPNLYKTPNGHKLAWHNCYSFGNGVESNRIRDNFNLPFITNGVKVSTTLEHDYEEEHRKYGLIYSGVYNSVSGINNLNQFIAAEKITKDVNPIYGSIQKLHSRNSDLVTLCEDKVLKILANKDAVFNADGNTNLTATENVLGQTIPFSGEFGISTNPESFASENYRAYFTDKVRGKVLRLSMDGLTPISDAGMNDWFRDNLKITDVAIGSYDDKKDQYNLTLKGTSINTTVTYKEDVKGWVSFKSFTPENAISMANDYYTFNQGNLFIHHVDNADRNTFYNQFTESSISVVLNDNPGVIKAFNTLNYEGSQSKVDKFSIETKVLPFQPDTDYNDQEYYNLSDKLGWYVGDIVTDKETGYISEFLEKEGKWFNNINRDININLDKADTSDFTFQGIAQVSDVETEKANPIVLDLPPEIPSLEPVTVTTTDEPVEVATDQPVEVTTDITIDIKTDKPVVTETRTDFIDDTITTEPTIVYGDVRDEEDIRAREIERTKEKEAAEQRDLTILEIIEKPDGPTETDISTLRKLGLTQEEINDALRRREEISNVLRRRQELARRNINYRTRG